MKINQSFRVVISAVSFLLVPTLGLAGSPTEWVRASVAQMKNSLAEHEPGERLSREKIMEVSRLIADRFDFFEMARLSLGRHWQQRSPKERQEFVQLFRNLLQQSHFMKMTNEARSEQRFLGERIDGERAVVHAMVMEEQSEVPIDYHLIRNNGHWRIFDVGVDGMRLSHVYRTQFNKVIARGSYDELIKRMQIKLQEVAFEAGVER